MQPTGGRHRLFSAFASLYFFESKIWVSCQSGTETQLKLPPEASLEQESKKRQLLRAGVTDDSSDRVGPKI